MTDETTDGPGTTPGPLPPLGRLVRGTGPGLLLAHGAGGGIDANYGPVMDVLAERNTVVGPDYPGTGRSPAPPGVPLTLDGLADALVATAVEEGVETFAVAGYSLGVPVAVRAATRHPGRVTALALTAGFARPNPRLRLLAEVWRELLAAGDGPAERRRLAGVMALLAFGAPALDALDRAAVDEAVRLGAGTVPAGTPAQLALLLGGVDVAAELPALRVPTLVVSTTQDALVTPYHHRRLAEAVPGARFVELAAGHLPFVECPAEWGALLREFLDETAGTAESAGADGDRPASG